MGRRRREKWRLRAGRAWGVPHPHAAAGPSRLEALPPPVLGALAGGAFSLLLIGVGAIRLIAALAMGDTVAMDGALRGLLFYVGGFVVGGFLAGLIWPVRRWIGGEIGLGIVVMGCVMLAIVRSEEGPFSTWDRGTWVMVAGLSMLFGVALGGGAQRGARVV